jgi:pyridoxal phosphate enzyme (YggS family)
MISPTPPQVLISRLQTFLDTIPQAVTPVLATKYATAANITAISSVFPHLIFGENRVQSGLEKQAICGDLPNDWHFIGHLQRNKVKMVCASYRLIQSVDSVRLLDAIHHATPSDHPPQPVLLQINPLDTPTQYGLSESAIQEIIAGRSAWSRVAINGLMGIAPQTSDTELIKKTFKQIRQLYDNLNRHGALLSVLSMGMSNDYRIAIDEGATMIRIGSVIFK